ncbi:GNAT family N-acetyltransferase [Flavobacteriaceae bacterium GSB9]|nr:GNAT family N-acetyltransferase [Flavobacteriaceae bacterium GSB9]
MNFNIKQISANKTYEVRQPILRPGKPIETCYFEGDQLKTTLHFGIFSDKNLLGVSSFFKNNHPSLSESTQYQLRGMAVLTSHQGKDLGRTLLNYGEQALKLKQVNIIWCNAREVSVSFYKKNNYQTFGSPFIIEGIGPHYVMFKKL